MEKELAIKLCVCAYHTIMTYVKQLSGKSYCVNVSPGKRRTSQSWGTWYK